MANTADSAKKRAPTSGGASPRALKVKISTLAIDDRSQKRAEDDETPQEQRNDDLEEPRALKGLGEEKRLDPWSVLATTGPSMNSARSRASASIAAPTLG